MKAYILENNNIQLKEINQPSIEDHQILIHIKAISLNPVDYKVTQGAFNLSTPRVIGIDAAGDVVAIGKKVKNITIGERVFAMVNIFDTGSFAEYVAVDSSIVSKIPSNVSYQEAATIPCAGVTAWQAIHQKINLQKGQTIYISAGGGAVGGYAIQLAKRKGATVITTASKDFDRIKNLGADHIVNYKTTDVSEEILKLTNNAGVDYIINNVSGKDIEKYAHLLRFNGTIVGVAGIPKTYPFPTFSKAAGITEIASVAAYTGGDINTLKEIAEAGNNVAKLISDKEITANITKEITFEEIPEALQWFAEGKTSGKIIAINNL